MQRLFTAYLSDEVRGMRGYFEYRIRSGRCVEVKRVAMELGSRSVSRSRGRKASKSAESKIRANEREQAKNLARTLNCNFDASSVFVTLHYPNGFLPSSREEAKAYITKFLRRAKDIFKRRYPGKTLRYVLVTADRQTKKDAKARIHHHIVMDDIGWELVRELWFAEYAKMEYLDATGDYTKLAVYMLRNVDKHERERAWTTSRGNLEKPVYEAPVPVTERGRIRIPKNASLKERTEYVNAETLERFEYCRWTVPAPPRRKRVKRNDN